MKKIEELNLNDLPEIKIIKKYNNHTKSIIEYLNCPVSFDIETTSTYSNGNKFAFMYEWTFGIINKNFIFYGRTWNDFKKLCNKLHMFFNLSNERILIIYVHNLSYEFQFIRKYFIWKNVFAVDDRKPIKALTTLGIEFRDSYILSGYGLAKTAENLTNHKIKKLVGDLDYSKVRTFQTYLYPNELEYCNNDVEIILDYIEEQIEYYGDITKIPLTNTGRVRRYVKQNCFKNRMGKKTKSAKARYIKLMSNLTLTLDVYLMLKLAFQGGYTHSSLLWTNKLLKNVHSIDFTSSYPYSMLSEKYPMSKAIPVELKSKNEITRYLQSDTIGLLMTIQLTGIHSKNTWECYLSESKCYHIEDNENYITNNGRIFQCDSLVTTITDIDYKIIMKCYNIEHVKIIKCYKYILDYLPYPIIRSILDLYKNKTMLKGVEGKEIEYLLSKGMLNSIYGMCVTDITRPEIIYNDNWEINKLTNESKEEQIEKYNNDKGRFLYYPWGVWVTAYSRFHLWQGILAMGDDYIYSDTDSIKFFNYNRHIAWINSYNDECDIKLHKMCDFYNIDFQETRPKTIQGKIKPIGYFDYEGMYTYFKTLGAKRYMYFDTKLKITIAGLSKSKGVEYLLKLNNGDIVKCFNYFTDDMIIPESETGKNTHTYIDYEMEDDIIDYTGLKTHVKSLSSIHLSETSFKLSMSDKYLDVLEMLRKGEIYIGEGRMYI